MAGSWGFILAMMGSIGFILVGIFSRDRAGPDRVYHNACAGFAFGGFVVSVMLYSLVIIFAKTNKVSFIDG